MATSPPSQTKGPVRHGRIAEPAIASRRPAAPQALPRTAANLETPVVILRLPDLTSAVPTRMTVNDKVLFGMNSKVVWGCGIAISVLVGAGLLLGDKKQPATSSPPMWNASQPPTMVAPGAVAPFIESADQRAAQRQPVPTWKVPRAIPGNATAIPEVEATQAALTMPEAQATTAPHYDAAQTAGAPPQQPALTAPAANPAVEQAPVQESFQYEPYPRQQPQAPNYQYQPPQPAPVQPAPQQPYSDGRYRDYAPPEQGPQLGPANQAGPAPQGALPQYPAYRDPFALPADQPPVGAPAMQGAPPSGGYYDDVRARAGSPAPYGATPDYRTANRNDAVGEAARRDLTPRDPNAARIEGTIVKPPYSPDYDRTRPSPH